MFKQNRLFVLGLIFFPIIIFSQSFSPVGTWKYLFQSSNYIELETIENDIYANGEYSLFYFNSTSEEILTLTKPKGLNEYKIDHLKYNSEDNILLLAYSNCTIDIIDFNNNKKITPNFDIYNKIFIGDKKINEIKFKNNLAYLSTSLGIVVFDYKKNLIIETYQFGDKENLTINSFDNDNNFAYAISENNLYTAPIHQSLNLQDFKNWDKPSLSIKDSFLQVIEYKNSIYLLSNDNLYLYEKNNLVKIAETKDSFDFYKLKLYNEKLYLFEISSSNSISQTFIYEVESKKTILKNQYQDKIKDFVISKEGEYYLISNFLYKGNELSKKIFYREYPKSYTNKLKMIGNDMYVNTGYFKDNLEPGYSADGSFVYSNNLWHQDGNWGDIKGNINQSNLVKRDDVFYKAFGRGGLCLQKDDKYTCFDNTNSIFKFDNNENRVFDIQIDSKTKTIWFLYAFTDFIVSIDKNDKWRVHSLSKYINNAEFRKLFIDSYGNKWILTRNKGLIMFNEKNLENDDDDVINYITTIVDDDSKLDVNIPLSIAEDKYNRIWIGGERGIASIYQCNYSLDKECKYFIPGQNIKNPNNPKDSTYETAFLNTAVTALAVDAGNRIWAGTYDGIFYVDESFSEKFPDISSELLKFNKLNSPFEGKEVRDILVHPNTGEVFISTEIGLMVYTGQSIVNTAEIFSNFEVKPNPIPSDYSGLISIDGIPDNSIFKITDVAGNLVYQGRSNGARAVWDCLDLYGNRPATGVYFVFSAQNGTQKNAQKAVGSFTLIR